MTYALKPLGAKRSSRSGYQKALLESAYIGKPANIDGCQRSFGARKAGNASISPSPTGRIRACASTGEKSNVIPPKAIANGMPLAASHRGKESRGAEAGCKLGRYAPQRPPPLPLLFRLCWCRRRG